ncbi:MAG: hypothetical protein ACREV9_16480 [Burkholderiales bacterium]
MKPGEWAEFKTANFSRGLLETPGSFITAFSDDAVWNPQRNELYFLGAGHGERDQTRFIKYSVADNAWSTIPLPSSLESIGHSYDHNAIDPATGAFYHRVYHTREVHKYDTSRQSWSVLPQWPSGYYVSITGGLEYFPEMGGLVYINGGAKNDNSGYALFFKDNAWREMRAGLHFGDYHTFSEYNPVERAIVFGGGEWYQQGESREMYKVDAAGKVAKLKDAPLDLGTHETVFTVDPVSGKYLVFGRDRSFWEYDLASDSWKKLESRVPFFTDTARDNPVQGTIASPISNYGVVMFVSYHANRVYLYKHR